MKLSLFRIKVLVLHRIRNNIINHHSSKQISMRKIFTLLALFFVTIAASATEYTDTMTVQVGDEVQSRAKATISVERQGDGSYRLQLANFVFESNGTKLPVGTINITAKATDMTKYTLLQARQSIQIAPGSTAGPWAGPAMGNVPVQLRAKQTNEKLYAIIDISVTGLNVQVRFGEGYQVPNSDFEAFANVTYDGKTTTEPNRWHTLTSSKGTFSGTVGGRAYTTMSSVTRPGTSGKHSVAVNSSSFGVWFFKTLINGTISTGRMQAGSSSPSNPKNNSFIDLSNTDKDANGDPYYTELNARPDSLTLWVKFKQGTPNAAHPYATATAVVTDGSYYQLPEDKTYNNIVAKAADTKIESKGFVWQRLSIPFEYVDKNLDPKAILVTISTNATPAQGSETDSLFVDDMSLVYTCGVTKMSVKGTEVAGFNENTTSYTLNNAGTLTADDIAVETKGAGAIVLKEVNGGTATVTVLSDDLLQSKTYTLNTTTGVASLNAETVQETREIYDINGTRVKDFNRKGVYILKDGKGNTRKVVR